MKKIVTLLAAGVLSVAGFGTFKGSEVFLVSTVQASGNTEINKPVVTVVSVEYSQINETASFPGRVAALRQAEIRPQVDGIITEVLFQPGALVKKGQPLYQIDPTRYEVRLASARAEQQQIETNIESLEPRMKRYSSLVKNGAVSQQDYEDVRTELDELKSALQVAKANVKASEVDLDFSIVRATISGQTGRTTVSDGALARSGQANNTLTVITQIDPMNVDLQLTVADAVNLRQRFGISAELPVKVMLGNDKTPYAYPGKTMFTEATVEAMTGAVFLRTEFPNPDGMLMPGTYAKAIVDFGVRQVLLVPQRATTRKPDGGLIVWVVDDEGIANQRAIQANHAWKDQWIVESGLEVGETIIMTGYQKIGPGTTVRAEPCLPKPIVDKG